MVAPPAPEPAAAAAPPATETRPPAPEEADLTWEDKEDKEGKADAENIKPDADKKYQYKEGVSLDFDPSYLAGETSADHVLRLRCWKRRS